MENDNSLNHVMPIISSQCLGVRGWKIQGGRACVWRMCVETRLPPEGLWNMSRYSWQCLHIPSPLSSNQWRYASSQSCVFRGTMLEFRQTTQNCWPSLLFVRGSRWNYLFPHRYTGCWKSHVSLLWDLSSWPIFFHFGKKKHFELLSLKELQNFFWAAKYSILLFRGSLETQFC